MDLGVGREGEGGVEGGGREAAGGVGGGEVTGRVGVGVGGGWLGTWGNLGRGGGGEAGGVWVWASRLHRLCVGLAFRISLHFNDFHFRAHGPPRFLKTISLWRAWMLNAGAGS